MSPQAAPPVLVVRGPSVADSTASTCDNTSLESMSDGNDVVDMKTKKERTTSNRRDSRGNNSKNKTTTGKLVEQGHPDADAQGDLDDGMGMDVDDDDNDNDDDNDDLLEEKEKASLMGVDEIDNLFPTASAIAVVSYILLVGGLYMAFPNPDDWVILNESERLAAKMAVLISFMGSALMAATVFVWSGRAWSGIIVAASVVQLVALVTNYLLAYYPTIVVVDPYTGARVFLLRWCEWVPLAGLMTFLSDSADIPVPREGQPKWQVLKVPVLVALSQSFSCAFAFYFPFAPSWGHWGVAMAGSVSAFLFMFPRLSCKFQAVRKMDTDAKKISFLGKENRDRVVFSRNLFAVCTAVWSVLVFFYFGQMVAIAWLPPEHYIRQHPSLSMILDTCFDALAKCLYMRVIVEVHILVFDRDLRARRQLWELRKLMTVLWDTSSDAIVISIRQDKTRITSLLSPAFAQIIGAGIQEYPNETAAILLESYHPHGLQQPPTSSSNGCQQADGQVVKASFVDYAEIPWQGHSKNPKQNFPTDSPIAQAALSVAVSSWNHCPVNGVVGDKASLFVHAQQKLQGSGLSHCEVQVSKHRPNALVAVVRDVSERYRRFEAERRVHAETRARQRDALAVNRFTRHEVKNGLLSGIEILNHMKALQEGREKSPRVTTEEDEEEDENAAEGPTAKSRRCINELEKSMHEMLDIVLAEAMARDVIHEVYHPKVERVDIMALLANSNMGVGVFPLETEQSDLPILSLDPQLVRHIHRNAISNACKYGRQGAPVVTRVAYSKEKREFRMQVINEPGEGHEALVTMGRAAEEAIFAQGTRLHTHLDRRGSRISSGDGAWIMQKCAKTMGGSCEIAFEEDLVVFTFTCPAEYFKHAKLGGNGDFEVPRGTWGVGVDDSKIQRKVLRRILLHAGVFESRTIILGSTPAEALNIPSVITRILDADENSKVLVLMDENLDYGQNEGVMSGSKVMMDVLHALPEQQRSRILALVRSANDSAEDVALYLKRLHGFFPKAPMAENQVRETMSTLWDQRFPRERDDDDESSLKSSSGLGTVDMDDIIGPLKRVEGLLEESPLTEDTWPAVWQALHALKGDLMVLDGSDGLVLAYNVIADLKGPHVPRDFEKKWESIRKAIWTAVGESMASQQ